MLPKVLNLNCYILIFLETIVINCFTKPKKQKQRRKKKQRMSLQGINNLKFSFVKQEAKTGKENYRCCH